MKKLIITLIWVAILAGMVITNPKKAAHNEAIAVEYKEALQKKVGVFSLLAGQKTLEMVVDSAVEVSDYVLLSVGKYSSRDNMSSVVSVGLFNHVFVFSKDDIIEEMGRALGM